MLAWPCICRTSTDTVSLPLAFLDIVLAPCLVPGLLFLRERLTCPQFCSKLLEAAKGRTANTPKTTAVLVETRRTNYHPICACCVAQGEEGMKNLAMLT